MTKQKTIDKQRRCLKFTGYLYIPDKKDLGNKGSMNYWLGTQSGRIQLFDEKGKKVGGKMLAFNNLGNMCDKLSKQWRKMFKARVK